MKKNILFVALAAFLPAMTFAQLKVESNGMVKVHDISTLAEDSTTCKTAMLVRKDVVSGKVNTGLKVAASNASTATVSNSKSIGISATAGNGTSGRNYAMIGNLRSSSTKGAAVLGTIGKPEGLDINGTYAGYFDGDTHVKGNLTVSGKIDGALFDITNSSNWSPGPINEDVLAKICRLRPQRFSYLGGLFSEMGIANGQDSILVELTSDSALQDRVVPITLYKYGFLPESVQFACPEISNVNLGSYSLNYSGLIPLLVQAIKDLKDEVDSLGEELAASRISSTRTARSLSAIEPTSKEFAKSFMSQNSPNPFSERTEIAITLPESVQKAILYIYDMTGKQVEQHEITERGNTSMTIYADRMDAGMYIYALVADGKVITSKKMIVTK